MSYLHDIIDEILFILQEIQVFTDEEVNELNKSIKLQLEDYISNNILDIMNPDFDKKLTQTCYETNLLQIIHLYNENIHDRIEYKLKYLIHHAKISLYTKMIPPRSYKNSYIRRIIPNQEHLTEKINILQSMPQPNQRSDEWYIFRHNLLTASSIWKAFGSQASKNQLIYEKCKPHCIFKGAPINSPLHWGQKYEPVSVEFYTKSYNTEISDFGCIQHPKYPFIGASPDGINTDANNARYGRMLEVKNIVNRVINGIPKMEYWIQMQIQMETCDLNECDFLETKFVEYENEEAFNSDGSYTYSADNKLKGQMIMFYINGSVHYEYAPLYNTEKEFCEWEKDILNKNSHGEWIKNIFWKLEIYSNILVLRNKLWFEASIPIIEELWNNVINERISGYEHRAPNKRKRIPKLTEELIVNKCYIQTNTDMPTNMDTI